MTSLSKAVRCRYRAPMSPSAHLPRAHFLLAVAVMAVWGSNLAAALVMGGLALSLLWPRFAQRKVIA